MTGRLEGNREGTVDGITVGIRVDKGAVEEVGAVVGNTVGNTVGNIVGDEVGDKDNASGDADGLAVLMVHVPQVDVPLDTRVPVLALYVPVSPDIVTKLPVAIPVELAQLPLEVVAKPNQLPAAPLAEVSYAKVARGLPVPVQPDDELNKQPAVQTVHTVGQSAAAA